MKTLSFILSLTLALPALATMSSRRKQAYCQDELAFTMGREYGGGGGIRPQDIPMVCKKELDISCINLVVKASKRDFYFYPQITLVEAINACGEVQYRQNKNGTLEDIGDSRCSQ